MLDTWFPDPQLSSPRQCRLPGRCRQRADQEQRRRGVHTETVLVEIDLDAAPGHHTPDAYLRLHLLSARLVRPRELNLDGIFGVLPNVVWTSAGPCAVEVSSRSGPHFASAGGSCTVFGVDKFPRMVDYVVPSGVRIADADRVLDGCASGVRYDGDARRVCELQQP